MELVMRPRYNATNGSGGGGGGGDRGGGKDVALTMQRTCTGV